MTTTTDVAACGCTGIYDGCQHGRGECENTPGGHRSPYFCATCDPRRIAHISATLNAIVDDFKADEDTHEFRYRAGVGAGLGLPVGEPHWYCSCGRWMIRAVPRPNADGNNKRQAERGYKQHLRDTGARS